MLKNRTTRVATLLLALTLITCCFVGSTFAKYTSDADATAVATIAKWDVQVGDQTLGTESKIFTFDLFETIKDTNGENEANVFAEDGKVVRIAPGTSGSFAIVLKNASEVDAKFDIAFDIEGPEVPFVWNVTYGEGANQTNNTLNGFEDVVFAMGETVTVTVSWEWPFGDDVVDTAFGVADDKTVTVTAEVTVEQVD